MTDAEVMFRSRQISCDSCTLRKAWVIEAHMRMQIQNVNEGRVRNKGIKLHKIESVVIDGPVKKKYGR